MARPDRLRPRHIERQLDRKVRDFSEKFLKIYDGYGVALRREITNYERLKAEHQALHEQPADGRVITWLNAERDLFNLMESSTRAFLAAGRTLLARMQDLQQANSALLNMRIDVKDQIAEMINHIAQSLASYEGGILNEIQTLQQGNRYSFEKYNQDLYDDLRQVWVKGKSLADVEARGASLVAKNFTTVEDVRQAIMLLQNEDAPEQ